ncbi:MAG: hypothetical protein IJ333_00510, partial [Clostridia bacterium]|nr:hypothetical protein [Clostridia bacterium]
PLLARAFSRECLNIIPNPWGFVNTFLQEIWHFFKYYFMHKKLTGSPQSFQQNVHKICPSTAA